MRILATLLLALVLAATAGGASQSGLRGIVLIDPASPVCRVGGSCTKPAAHVWLAFTRQGRTTRTRTGARGGYRITLAPGTYAVTTPTHTVGRGPSPHRVTVRSGMYRRVVFRIDIGIR